MPTLFEGSAAAPEQAGAVLARPLAFLTEALGEKG